MSVAFLFPGQGSQEEGMLHRLLTSAGGRAVLGEASETLGFDALDLDTGEALRSTRNTQLALLISAVAGLRQLEQLGALPDMVAGLSVGAFGAAISATGLDFGTTLDLVSLRGRLMEEAFPAGYGMAAIIGLDERQMTALIADVNRLHPIYLAGANSPRQITVSGNDDGLDLLITEALAAGAATAKRLRVAVPSHCRLLLPAAERLRTALEKIEISRPQIPYADYRGRIARDSAAIRTDLATNLAHPVRWHDATTVLFELGARLFVELSPGRVLTDLAAAAFPEARALACGPDGLANVAALVRRCGS
jgi:malonate decarboxylase epsilon subunit